MVSRMELVLKCAYCSNEVARAEGVLERRQGAANDPVGGVGDPLEGFLPDCFLNTTPSVFGLHLCRQTHLLLHSQPQLCHQ